MRQFPDAVFIQRFPCEQFARAPLQHFSVNFENSVCTIKHTHHDVTDGLVDACLSRFGYPAATLYQFRRLKKEKDAIMSGKGTCMRTLQQSVSNEGAPAAPEEGHAAGTSIGGVGAPPA